MTDTRTIVCAGCLRELVAGDRYIKDTPSEFLKSDADDAVIAGIFGGTGDTIIYCEDCTEAGGDHVFETVE